MPVYHSRRRELGNHLNTVTLLTGREGKFTSLNHAKPHFCTWYYSASLAQPHHNFVGRGNFSTASLHWLWLSGGIVREKLTVSVGGLVAQCLGKGGIDLGGDGGRTKPASASGG
jgi:hypothetical protein